MDNNQNQDTLFVVVKFKIPFGLFWQDDIIINMNSYIVRIITKRCFVKNNGLFECSGEGVQLKKDRQGKLNKTEIICLLEFNSQNDDENYYLRCAIEATNRLLEMYRNIYKEEFFVDRVRESDLSEHCKLFLMKDKTIRGSNTLNIGISLSPQLVPIPDDIKEMLISGFSFPVWKNALSNAKNYYDLEDFSQTIIQANICLENFIYTHILDRLKNVKTEEEINAFLKGNSPCIRCKFQTDTTNPEMIIDPYKPSIYKVIKYMYYSAACIGRKPVPFKPTRMDIESAVTGDFEGAGRNLFYWVAPAFCIINYINAICLQYLFICKLKLFFDHTKVLL